VELALLAPPSPPPVLLALEDDEVPVFGSELQPCPAEEMPAKPAVKRSAQPIRLFVVDTRMNRSYSAMKSTSTTNSNEGLRASRASRQASRVDEAIGRTTGFDAPVIYTPVEFMYE